jgi:procollagen-lysine,2-oxoglutarate 5-dioxygenase
VPLIVHGNGGSKLLLNSLGNYVANSWSLEEGCLNCWKDTIELDDAKPSQFPKLLVAIFIEKPTPFLEEFLRKIRNQVYPEQRLHLFVHNNMRYHEDLVQAFLETEAQHYKSVKQIRPEDEIDEVSARNLAM